MLVIPDSEWMELVRAKLLLTTANAAAVCLTCGVTVVDLSHAWTCVSLSLLRTARHNVIVQRLTLACWSEKAVREFVLTTTMATAPADADQVADHCLCAPGCRQQQQHSHICLQTPFTRLSGIDVDSDDSDDSSNDNVDDNNLGLVSDEGGDDLLSKCDNGGDSGCDGDLGMGGGPQGGSLSVGLYVTVMIDNADDVLDASCDTDDADEVTRTDIRSVKGDGCDNNSTVDDDYNYNSDLDAVALLTFGEASQSCSGSNNGGGRDSSDSGNLDYELSDQLVTRSVSKNPNPTLAHTATAARQSLAELRANLWLPGLSTAIDVVVAASCRLGRARAFEQATYRKNAKYRPAIEDSTIARVVPFIMSPFGAMAKPAKAFIKHVMSGIKPTKIMKARLQLSVAVACSTVQLSHTWSACTALSIGGF
jgi:hypothetical protein